MLSLWDKIKTWLMLLSPIVIKPSSTDVTIGFSKRFFLFNILGQLTDKLERDPHLNFVSALKYYNVLGKFLYGTISQLYFDRRRSYFKRFFKDPELYKIVKRDIEWAYAINRDLKLTITKNGLIIYDNYKHNAFNILLLTVHSGNWTPKNIQDKQLWSRDERLKEEDTDTDKIYAELVLKKNGIWIDNKLSRFACDYNRNVDKCIYKDDSEGWLSGLWREPLSDREQQQLKNDYHEFYFTLSKLVNAYKFNLILDGHSMRDMTGRPEMSFGTEFIPRFYMPMIYAWQVKLRQLGYGEATLDVPYRGGNIVRWLNERFPNVFIASMEVNKKLYTNPDETAGIDQKIKTLAGNLEKMFDTEIK